MAYLTTAQKEAIASFRAKFHTVDTGSGDEVESKKKTLTEEQIIRLHCIGQKLDNMLQKPVKA